MSDAVVGTALAEGGDFEVQQSLSSPFFFPSTCRIITSPDHTLNPKSASPSPFLLSLHIYTENWCSSSLPGTISPQLRESLCNSRKPVRHSLPNGLEERLEPLKYVCLHIHPYPRPRSKIEYSLHV